MNIINRYGKTVLLIKCINCGKVVSKRESICLEDEEVWVCCSCNEGVNSIRETDEDSHCFNCGNSVTINNGHGDMHGHYVCKDCYDGYDYKVCNGCGIMYPSVSWETVYLNCEDKCRLCIYCIEKNKVIKTKNTYMLVEREVKP